MKSNGKMKDVATRICFYFVKIQTSVLILIVKYEWKELHVFKFFVVTYIF